MEDIQEVAEGDEILEEEEDVLDLGVVDELESELDEGHTQGMQHVKNYFTFFVCSFNSSSWLFIFISF